VTDEIGISMHRCPGRCGRRVPQHLFACRGCWARLPKRTRTRIQNSYGRNRAEHAQAMSVAIRWYAEHQAGSS
jgi:hypothetical protein